MTHSQPLATTSPILKSNVLLGEAAVDSIATALYGQMVTMLNEVDVTIDVRDSELYINASKVTIKDIPATNGIIHVIDTVLIPESEEAADPHRNHR